MLARTFLSSSFPWGGGEGIYSSFLPPGRGEAIAIVHGLWDNGAQLSMFTISHIRAYPSWRVVLTRWDRASGVLNGTTSHFYVLGEDIGVFGFINALAYLEGLSQARDGIIWANYNGPYMTISPFMLSAGGVEEFSWTLPTAKSLRAIAERQLTTQAAQLLTEEAFAQQTASNLSPLGAEVSAAGKPGVSAPSGGGYSFASLGIVSAHVFLIVGNGVVLANFTPTSGSLLPRIRPAGLILAGAGGVPIGPYIPLPAQVVSLAYDDGTRVWALLADNTAVCVDYMTGEPSALVWLPLPSAAGGNSKLAWQRSYRRLLVITPLPSYDESNPRNHWQTRIVGYSTTPLPVRVCTPIPLRPVRAGRPTPFLIRQVGSLGEAVTGSCTLTPGAGVTVDRVWLTFDELGEAEVMLTASAEGTASLTASIEVIATWDAPGVYTPFAGEPEPWIEGT